MKRNKVNKTFNELYEIALLEHNVPPINYNELSKTQIEIVKTKVISLNEALFKIFLKDKFQLEILDDSFYKNELTNKNMTEFVKQCQKREKELKNEVENVKNTWKTENKLPKDFDCKEIVVFDSKKHNLNISQVPFLPNCIRDYYEKRNKFIYFSTETAKNIPVLELAFQGKKVMQKGKEWLIAEFPIKFDCYAIGFLKGFEDNFIPFIDTPNNKREVILKAVGCWKTGFPTTFEPIPNPKKNERSAFYKCEEFYEMGFKYGRNYKAWLLVLETPKYFENEPPFIKSKINKKAELDKQITVQKGNEYNHQIFTSYQGAIIFDKLINARKKTRFNDYCVFVYRQLIKDGFMIDVKQAVYKEYILKNYGIGLDKFKPLEVVSNTERLNLYSSIVDGTK